MNLAKESKSCKRTSRGKNSQETKSVAGKIHKTKGVARKQITETIPKILKHNKDRPAAFLITASKTELKTAALESLLLRETKQT